MVKVRWSENEGLIEVLPLDGPGEHTDDIETETLTETLHGAGNIGERLIASVIASQYEGKLSDHPCHVTTDSYVQQNEIIETIAFIELDDPEDRLSMWECDQCSGEKQPVSEIREDGTWRYEDWKCPQCNQILHTDLVKTPKSA